MSLRNKLIRLAFEQPQLRDDILPLVKEGGDFTKEEWKAHKEKHPGAEEKDHNITDGKSEKKDDGDNLNAPKKNIFKDHSKLKSDLESFAEDNDIDLDFGDIMELEEEWEDALYDLEDKDEDKAEEFKKKMGEFFKSNEKQMKIQSKIETMSENLENDDSSKGKFILSMLDNMGESSDPTTHLKTLKDVLFYVSAPSLERKKRKDKVNEDTIKQIKTFEIETVAKGKFHLSRKDQQKALEEYIGEIERVVGGETKSKGKKATLRSSLIRLAYTHPQFRGDLLPLVTKSAGAKRLQIGRKQLGNNVTILLQKEWYSKPNKNNGFRDDLIQAKFFVYGGSKQDNGRGAPGYINGKPVFAEVMVSEQPSGEMYYELGRDYVSHPDYAGNRLLVDFLEHHQDTIDRRFF